MTFVQLCQVKGCNYMAALRIGHTSDLIFMCLKCANHFKDSDTVDQRRVLRECQPQRRRSYGKTNVHTPPAPIRERQRAGKALLYGSDE